LLVIPKTRWNFKLKNNMKVNTKKFNIEELLKVEGAKCVVTEKNEPNITLIAQAFINLSKQTNL